MGHLSEFLSFVISIDDAPLEEKLKMKKMTWEAACIIPCQSDFLSPDLISIAFSGTEARTRFIREIIYRMLRGQRVEFRA